MLLCCFKDADSDKEDVPTAPQQQPQQHKVRPKKGRDGTRLGGNNQGPTREPSSSRQSSSSETGVVLSPIIFHPTPMTVEPKASVALPPKRSTSVCSTTTSEQGQGLSRQSSQQSTSHFSVARPPSRDGSDKRRTKEKAPLSKEAKRLRKQRSQESFSNHPQGGLVVDGARHSTASIPYIDQTPPTMKTVTHDQREYRKDTVSNSSSPLRQFADERRRQSACSTLSTPNLQAVSPSNTGSIQVYDQLAQQQRPHQSSTTQLSKIEEKIQGRGMCRSSASYGIQQMLQEQISRDEYNAKAELERELACVVSTYEERINNIKQEHNLQIQQVLREKSTSLNNARNTFETELQIRTQEIQETLKSQMVAELEYQRRHYENDIAETRTNYEKDIFEAGLRHQATIDFYQERDQSWQIEKQEVLGEIKRLKDEASRFIAILSQEEEYEKSDQQLSPSKRQALTKEVESLQLVVEMRTAEVRQLREERGKLLEQLSALENTRNILDKMSAKVEDLQAQLEAKSEIERQLSLEKSQLESSFETESKNKARMSMQVEELQWRIKNNLELPSAKIFMPESPMSMDESQWIEISGPMSMSANQSFSMDAVVLRKPRSANSTPRKEVSNKTPAGYDVWGKLKNQENSTGFSMSLCRTTSNNNPDSDECGLDRATELNISNNNLIHCTSDEKVFEKRDHSTEKMREVVNDNQDDIEENNLSIADSLENLETKAPVDEDEEEEEEEETNAPVACEEEFDEGLGDINHGSEASSSPQPASLIGIQKSSNNINNNLIPDDQQQPLTFQPSQPLEFETPLPAAGQHNKHVGSPCDERVPSRIPFSLQTNL